MPLKYPYPHPMFPHIPKCTRCVFLLLLQLRHIQTSHMNLATSTTTGLLRSRVYWGWCSCGAARSVFLGPYVIDLGYDQETYIDSCVEEVSYRPGNRRQTRLVARHPNPENDRCDNHHSNVDNNCIKDMTRIRNVLGDLSRDPCHNWHQKKAQ